MPTLKPQAASVHLRSFLDAFEILHDPHQVHSYDASRETLARHGASHLSGAELTDLLRRAERGSISRDSAAKYQRFIQQNRSFWLRAVLQWEGNSLYLGTEDMADNVSFSLSRNAHFWTESPLRGTLFELPKSARRQNILLEVASFDEYGRTAAPQLTKQNPVFEVLCNQTFSIQELCAANPTFSSELFGVPYHVLPSSLTRSVITLPAKAGVPLPIAYQPLWGKFGGTLYTNRIVGIRR